MKVELQFINDSGDRINELDMVYEGNFVPVPDPSDFVLLEGKNYTVKSKEYMYFSGGFKGDVRILIYVEERI